jgi:mono/diheme cytochrome c family protein
VDGLGKPSFDPSRQSGRRPSEAGGTVHPIFGGSAYPLASRRRTELIPFYQAGQETGAETLVNFRFLVRKNATVLGWFAPALLWLVVLSGCNGDGYPDDLTYPPRTDPLVSKPPDSSPPGFDLPGEIFHLMDDPNSDLLKSKSAVILFPDRDPRPDKEKQGKPLTDKQRGTINKALSDQFGTPRNPRVKDIDKETKVILKLDDSRLAEGSRLYRLHCLHCHGVPGDGRGPTAAWVNPHPRDFRQGIFKFTSISQKVELGNRKARREDLLRTLRNGVEGTAMPSFGLLPEHDLEALVSYVIHLSMRGQAEFIVIEGLMKGEGAATYNVKDVLAILAENWKQSNAPENILKSQFPYPYVKDGKPIQPGVSDPDDEQLKESVRRGYKNFSNKQGANCAECHADYGRQSPLKYDSWGTVVRGANLTRGIYRGGRRAIDLYWRINAGINGSQMAPMPVKTLNPNANQKEKDEIKKQEQDIWDLVNFVQVLPYPNMLPEDIREKIYPEVKEKKEK